MSFQYIVDAKGHKNAVLLSVSDWKHIRKQLDDYAKLKSKKAFFEGLTNALIEVKQIKSGKRKPNSFDSLLNEL